MVFGCTVQYRTVKGKVRVRFCCVWFGCRTVTVLSREIIPVEFVVEFV